MKKIVTILLATVMSMSLVACGGSESNKGNTNTSIKEESTYNNSKEEPIVLVDNGVTKITYTGVDKSSIFGYEIGLEIENKSERSITVQVREVSVDGVMVNPIFSADIAGGKKSKSSMTISEDEVSKLVNVEGLFHIFDGESWNAIGDYEFKLLQSEGSSNNSNESSEGTVLVDNDIVKIEYMGKGNDSIFGPTVKVRIENKTDSTITVQTREISVDGYMIDPIFSCDIAAGKKSNDEITFMKDEVSELNNIEGKFTVIDGDSWNDLGEYPFVIE